jgi:hypothetical protein
MVVFKEQIFKLKNFDNKEFKLEKLLKKVNKRKGTLKNKMISK